MASLSSVLISIFLVITICAMHKRQAVIFLFFKKNRDSEEKEGKERILKIPLCDTQNPNGRFETNFSYCYFVYSSFYSHEKTKFLSANTWVRLENKFGSSLKLVLSWKTRQQFTKLNSSVKNNFRFQRLFVFVEQKKMAFFH